MVDEVEIVNVGNDGVASEETLVALLETMKKMAKSKGFDPAEVNKKTKDLAKNLSNLDDFTLDNTKALEDNTDAKNENTDALKKNTNYLSTGFSYALGEVIGSLSGFTKELIAGGSTLTDFSQHIPFIGSLISPITSYFDETMESFRELSSSGASFNNSLQDLRVAAAGAYMNLDEFTSFVVDNSDKLAALGGTATKGALEVTKMTRSLGTQRDQLLQMGFTFSDITESMAEYAYMTRYQGTMEQRNAAQVAASAAEYMKTLQTLSKLTGKSVDQLKEEQMATQNNLAFQIKMSKMSEEERAKAEALLLEAQAGGPAALARAKEMIMGLPPMTRETQLFAATMGDSERVLRERTEALKNESVSSENFIKGQSETQARLIAGMVKGATNLEQILAAGAAAGDGVGSEILQMLEKSGVDLAKYIGMSGEGLVSAIQNDIEAAKKETDNRDDLTNSLAEFENNIRRVRENIQTTLLDSGIFDLVSNNIQSLANMLDSPAFLGALENTILGVTSFFETLIQDVKTMGFWKAIGKSLSDGFSNIWEEIKLQLFGGTRDNTNRIESTDERLNELVERRNTLRARDARGQDVKSEEIQSVEAAIQQLRDERERLSQAQGQEVKGLLSDFGKNLPDMVFGMPDDQVTDLANQRMDALAEISALEARQQGGHGGNFSEEDVARLEELRTKVSELDTQLSNSDGMFGGLLDNLISMDNILIGGAIVAGIAAIGVALGSAAVPALAFGAAIALTGDGVGAALNGVSSIMDSMAENTRATTEQLERLSNIPSENLNNAAAGIERMKTAIEGFSPTSFDVFKEWAFGDDERKQESIRQTTSLIEQTADSFNNIDSAVINTASESISSLSSAIKAFNQATSIEGVGDLASRLIGYQDAASAIISLATSLENINGENLTNVAPGITSLSAAVGEFQKLTAISSAGEGISAVLKSYVPLAQTVTEVANDLASIQTPENITNVSTALPSVISAIGEFQKLTAISTAGEGISAVLQSYVPLAQTVTDVATSLSSVKTPENIANVSTALPSVITAIGEFQSLTAITSLGEGISAALKSYVPLAQTVTEVATDLASIQAPENLNSVTTALPSIVNAIDSFQSLTAITSIGEGVSAALQSYVPLSNSLTQVATSLASIETPENIDSVTQTLPSVISAIDSFQSLTSISSLGEGLSAVLDSYSTVTDPLIRLINSLAPIDGTQLTNVAPGIEAVSNALTVFKNSTGFSGIGDLVRSWFSDDAMSVGANIKTIADDLVNINANQLTNASTAIVAMSNAFETFSNADIDNNIIDPYTIMRLNSLATTSSDLEKASISLERIAGITNLKQNLDVLNEGLDPTGIRTYATAIDELIEKMNDLNEVLAESNDTLFKDNMSAAEVLGNINVSTQGTTDAISQLNTLMTQILTVLNQSKEIENKIERNTASLSNDTSRGYVSRIR